jgi:hypothetical protein
MKNRARVGVVVGTLLLVACSFPSVNGTDAGASGGVVTPSCYLELSSSNCDCYADNKDSSMSAANYKKVDHCNAATVGGLSCTADTTVDGTTTSCSCQRFEPACDDSSSPCRCEPDSSKTDKSCTPAKYEWCCGADDSSQCYCGTGNFGSACANGEHTVSNCDAGYVQLAKDAKTSCDDLKFVKK